ncbi:DNA-processing protein DprA [Nocardia sienata]|uniref:DNA-processing protein DprA n=1 Tax=Nocardia sienata TaxID=248552 RepID=UPI0007A4373B|nr:DNA-processing protein DprA [Nocardia sienata]
MGSPARPRAAGEQEERQLAWAYLSRVILGPCPALTALIDSVGVREAARAVRERALPPVLYAATERRRELDTAARDLEVIRGSGGRLVTPDDAEWPAWRMLGLAQLTPGRDPDGAVPLVFWVRGDPDLGELSERAVAVVGARCSTGYGDRVAGEIAGELAARGWTVVSGAAFGVDGTAHRAALAVGGATIAVLACGADRPYPAQHDRLIARIAETGLVVSEYPPGTVARKHHFLARNRLIAGLADGVLVVEAGLRSGARNTAKWARRIGRPALAVPGSVDSAASAGCHRMIRDGEATLVTGPEEVLAEIAPLHLPLSAGSAGADRLSGTEAQVLAALSVTGGRWPHDIAAVTGIAAADVRAALVALDLAGAAARGEMGWYRLDRVAERGG